MKFLKKAFAMAILLGVLITLIAFVPFVNAQEGEVTLNPTDDTYTSSDEPDSNFGGQLILWVSWFEFFETYYQQLVWLKFDLSNVPDGAVVDVATLELNCSIGTETFNVYAHSCSDNSWTELALTYSNMPTFNATSMDSTVVLSSGWHSWNVIDAVRSAVNGIHGGPDVVTLVLLETSLHDVPSSVGFDPRESIFPPKLTVHWSEVIPEFPTWTSILLILIVLTVAIIIFKRRLLKTPTH